mgnify:CR=1 FL=1
MASNAQWAASTLFLSGLACINVAAYQWNPIIGWIVIGMSLILLALIVSAESVKSKK